MGASPPPFPSGQLTRASALLSGPRLLGLVGDSRTAGIGATLHLAYSWPKWTETLSDGRVRVDSTLSWAVAGAKTGPVEGEVIMDMIGQARLAAASRADIVAVFGGTNDGLTEDTLGNLTTICGILTGAGKAVVLIAEAPRDIALGDPARKRFGVRAHCHRLAGINGVVVVDPWELLVDRTSATGAFASGMSYDGLHMTTTGCYYLGLAVANAINALYPAVPLLPGMVPAEWDATYNPYGPMLANPAMSGTGGALTTGVTGVLADSWSAARAGTGLSAVGSMVTDSTGKPAQQLVVSGTASSGTDLIKFRQNLTVGNLTAGDVIEGVCYFEVDAGAANIHGPALQLTGTGGSNPFTAGNYDAGTLTRGFTPAIAHKGVLRTPRMTYVGTTTTLRLEFNILGKNTLAGALTARVRDMTAYKV